MVTMTPVDSTNIESIGYDSETRELYVRFLVTLKKYVFFDVEEARYKEFMQAESKGTYLNEEIKTNYRYEKLEG